MVYTQIPAKYICSHIPTSFAQVGLHISGRTCVAQVSRIPSQSWVIRSSSSVAPAHSENMRFSWPHALTTLTTNKPTVSNIITVEHSQALTQINGCDTCLIFSLNASPARARHTPNLLPQHEPSQGTTHA
jgi:hypothetical protein